MLVHECCSLALFHNGPMCHGIAFFFPIGSVGVQCAMTVEVSTALQRLSLLSRNCPQRQPERIVGMLVFLILEL